MLNYTERIALLIDDIVSRERALRHVDTSRLLVFARFGRSGADGAYATCHCLNLPVSEPGYYFWRDRTTGVITRRSEWFVTKSPVVQVGASSIAYMVSFCLPRFCDQTFAFSRKVAFYPGAEPWMAKLDTIVHELYHVDPEGCGIRPIFKPNGTLSAHAHDASFFHEVARIVKAYLASRPDPETFDFLRYDFDSLQQRYGGIVGTAFRGYPSYPQRYIEAAPEQPATPDPQVRVEPLKEYVGQVHFTADDLHIREFRADATHRLVRTGQHQAA
jgi:hypothetical protein